MSVAATPLPQVSRLQFPPSLPAVIPAERSGSLLHATPLAGDGVLGLNLTRGCAHRCGFCSVRASPSYPGNEVLYLYVDTADRLHTELSTSHPKPRAVFLSPATDPFPPLAEVQSEAARVVATLARHGVEAWLMTRGLIRPALLEAIGAHPSLVRVTIPFTTMRRDLQRVLEPWTAPPRLRLRQVESLQQLGVAVQVSLEPLLPGLTDTPENLSTLLKALALAGVRHVTAGYLFLREGIADNLRADLESHGWADTVLTPFEGGPILAAPGLAPARYLPRTQRQRGYARLMSLAAVHGISVSVSRLLNPDFVAPPAPGPRQRLLPMFLKAVREGEISRGPLGRG
jgi:DNA repair photolyase